ncbi:hypothetical protein NMY22_g3606 [Coprinellus aureogranulatus]|nr:hypothetical protein NMY22_g3606 [Coprinellus aureogranulatus]
MHRPARTSRESKIEEMPKNSVPIPMDEGVARLVQGAYTATQGGEIPLKDLVKRCEDTEVDMYPRWLCKPYFRKFPRTAKEEEEGARKSELGIDEV